METAIVPAARALWHWSMVKRLLRHRLTALRVFLAEKEDEEERSWRSNLKTPKNEPKPKRRYVETLTDRIFEDAERRFLTIRGFQTLAKIAKHTAARGSKQRVSHVRRRIAICTTIWAGFAIV